MSELNPKVTWIKPMGERTDRGYQAVVGVSGSEKFTVELSRQRGFWYSTFGAASDLPHHRIRSGPFLTLELAKSLSISVRPESTT